jgi:hypothetical protein
VSALGCPEGYTVELRVRGGGRRIAVLDGIATVEWERVLSETSEATITLAPRGRECRSAVAGAIPWAHELAVWREEELVWEGPLWDVSDNGSSVTLTGRDVSQWLTKRLLRAGYDTEGDPVDVALLAEAMIRAALAPDDPEIGRYLSVTAAGITTERFVDEETTTAAADLADLTGLGLDWTTVGRRIALFGRDNPLGRLPALTSEHFTGPLPIAEVGANALTRAVVQGGGVRGEAGGVHPVLGLLEELISDTAVDSDEDAAVAAAAALYTPTRLLAGDVAVPLTPYAPVTIAQLVPGVVSALSGSGAGLAVDGLAAQLTKVAVTYAAEGETVTPTFVEFFDRTGSL